MNVLVKCFSVVPTEAFDGFTVYIPVNCVHSGVRPVVLFSVVVSDGGCGGSVSYFTVVFGSDLVVSNVQIDFVTRWCVAS